MLLSLVVPFYNEEDTAEHFFARVVPILSALNGIEYEIICVDDGSQNGVLSKLHTLRHRVGNVKIIELSRNVGKEAALTAGLDEANGDLIVPFDADLQAPPEVIPFLVEKWRQRYDVVLAKRVDRQTDTFAKRKIRNAVLSGAQCTDPFAPARQRWLSSKTYVTSRDAEAVRDDSVPDALPATRARLL